MKSLKIAALAAFAAALTVLIVASAASATVLTGSGGTTLGTGTTLSAESEKTVTLHGVFGTIECGSSKVSGKTTNAGGEGLAVNANLETLTFTECKSATVTVLAKGTLWVEGAGSNNGILKGSGNEVTTEFLGIHCIFKTSSTTLGTLTGSATTGKTATFDISSTIPRTGGRSGAFCGSTGEWAGSYLVTAPDTLNVNGTGGGGGGGGGGGETTSTTTTTSLSGETKSGEEITVNEGSKVKDQATISGTNAGKATGTVKYKVYADKECRELVTSAGEVTVTSGKVPASEEKELEAGRVYYWQAEYSGDTNNLKSTSTCGKEVLTVKAKTSIATSLSGESKSGEEITILEGSKAKDTATLSGTRSSAATGKAKYKVYADSECKELVSEAGEVTVTGGSVPASEEKTLEAGRAYYWQATYEGDSVHQASTSTCGKEILKIKATTSLSTSLSGEGKSGEEISVAEGAKVMDTATLGGTRSSAATGKVKFKVYKDKECKELASEAGEGTLGEGKAGSEEKTLAAYAVYYWQAEYAGDSLHQASSGTCGKEVLTVKYATSLSTSLMGEGTEEEEEVVEGEEISILNGAPVADTAKLKGTNSSTATGKVKYKVYKDKECKELVTSAGEVSVKEGKVPSSEEVKLEKEKEGGGAYYWQATYEGDSQHAESASSCAEIVYVVAPTSLSAPLSGEGQAGELIEVSEEAAVTAIATLSGENSKEATGHIQYSIYSDEECSELVAEAGKVTVEGKSAPPSEAETLEPGIYYWRAFYSGDSHNHSSRSACDGGAEVVLPPITTTLSGSKTSGEEIEVLTGTPVSDQATLHREHAAEATGTVKYAVYSDEECKELVAGAGEAEVEGETAPASGTVTLEEVGTYYWQAEYSGDENNPAAVSACGSEVAVVTAPDSLSGVLSGGGEEGPEIEVEEGTAVAAHTTLSGTEASGAKGSVAYTAYTNSSCTEVAEVGGVAAVEGGVAEPSAEAILPPGTYYWQAEYSGDAANQRATTTCGALVEVVTAPITTTLSSEGSSGNRLIVPEGASVTDEATLHGEHAAEATGTVQYSVYSDENCESLTAKAGEVEVKGPSVPPSSSVELKSGTYFWRASYSGDEKNPPAVSPCGAAEVQPVPETWQYAALGDSFSSGQGVHHNGGQYYPTTDSFGVRQNKNLCHRSDRAWPALLWESYTKNHAEVIPPQVVNQSPRFIFRACSGAETPNIWRNGLNAVTGGQWDEFRQGLGWWTTPAQAVWLRTLETAVPPNAPNPEIRRVSLTIGGNDAGFSTIARNCFTRTPRLFAYRPERCQNTIAGFRVTGFNAIRANLPVVLSQIEAWAPNADIGLFLYPHVLDLQKPLIPVGIREHLVINNMVPGNTGMTAAESVQAFLDELNATLANTVVAQRGLGRLQRVVIDARTVGAMAAFGPQPHFLGDPEPWLNGIIPSLNLKESFHPNICGHQAIAAMAQPAFLPGEPIAPC